MTDYAISLPALSFLFTVIVSSLTIYLGQRATRSAQRSQEELRLDTARRGHVDMLEGRVQRLERENERLQAGHDECQRSLALAHERIITLLSTQATKGTT